MSLAFSKHKKIGLFGGSFDPVHFGHLHLALEMLEKHGLDQVIFAPANISPFKKQAPPHTGASDRLEMVRLAIEPVRHFSLVRWEIEREGPSYTIDTVKKMYEEADQKGEAWKLHLILGEDALEGLPKWKDAEALVRLAPPLTGSRTGSAHSFSGYSKEMAAIVEEGITKIPILEISSTAIRDRLKKKMFCGHLVPGLVLDYIYSHSLY